MAHVTCRLAAKNQDQLRNPTLDNSTYGEVTYVPRTLLTLHEQYAMSGYVTVRCPSVRLSVPSIDNSSDMRLVCC